MQRPPILKVDIADPIWILSELMGDPCCVTTCKEAADANNDGLGPDVSDAVHLINYLFDGGPEPPAPFPGCGNDSDHEGGDTGYPDDDIDCAQAQTACSA